MCIKILYKYSHIFTSYVSNIVHVCVLLFMACGANGLSGTQLCKDFNDTYKFSVLNAWEEDTSKPALTVLYLSPFC